MLSTLRTRLNNPLAVSLLFYLVVQLLDLLTSYVLAPRLNVEESSPFMRDAAHHFVLLYGVFVKAAMTAALGLVSIVLLLVLRFWDERKAAVIACMPFVLVAIDNLLVAVMNNFFVLMGLYQP